MKKIALLIFFALFAHEGISQVWDSIGPGLPAPSGVRGIWKIADRLFASTTEVNTNLYEYSPQNGWTQIASSSQPGQILDVVYDSINNQAIILGKYDSLNGTLGSGMMKLNLAINQFSPIGIGVNYPAEYVYKGKIINGELIVVGRFQILNGDTIDNVMKVDLLSSSYVKVCVGKSGDLVRDFCVYNNDTVLTGSFLRNGIEYPLAKITPTGLDFSINGPYTGFGHSITIFNNVLVFAGDIDDTLQNLRVVGSYDGNVFSNITKTDNLIKKLYVFDGELHIGGFFSSVTDSSGFNQSTSRLAKYDGLTTSEAFGGCSGTNSSVWDLCSSGDTLYVAGNFTQAGNIQSLNVAKLIVPLSSSLNDENTFDTKVNIYPNPTDGNFQIDIGENFESEILVQVFDISGRKVEELITDLPTKQLNLDLPNGVYFIKIKENTTKLVIRK